MFASPSLNQSKSSRPKVDWWAKCKLSIHFPAPSAQGLYSFENHVVFSFSWCAGAWNSPPPLMTLFSTELNGVLNLLPEWGQERGWCYQAAANLWSLLSGMVIWGRKVGGPPGISNQHQTVYSSKLSPPTHNFWINNSIMECTCPSTRSNSKSVSCSVMH